MTSLREQAVERVAVEVCSRLESEGIRIHDGLRAAISEGAVEGFLEVLEKPSLDVKMAGAAAITADHMKAMANYDAATDCLSAMIRAIREGK